MKTLSGLFKKITTAAIAASIVFSVSTASAVTTAKHKASERTEKIHKVLEEKGYAHISDLAISKSDIHQTKYFVNFMNEGAVYDAYFTKKGELVEIYKVAEQ